MSQLSISSDRLSSRQHYQGLRLIRSHRSGTIAEVNTITPWRVLDYRYGQFIHDANEVPETPPQPDASSVLWWCPWFWFWWLYPRESRNDIDVSNSKTLWVRWTLPNVIASMIVLLVGHLDSPGGGAALLSLPAERDSTRICLGIPASRYVTSSSTVVPIVVQLQSCSASTP